MNMLMTFMRMTKMMNMLMTIIMMMTMMMNIAIILIMMMTIMMRMMAMFDDHGWPAGEENNPWIRTLSTTSFSWFDALTITCFNRFPKLSAVLIWEMFEKCQGKGILSMNQSQNLNCRVNLLSLEENRTDFTWFAFECGTKHWNSSKF